MITTTTVRKRVRNRKPAKLKDPKSELMKIKQVKITDLVEAKYNPRKLTQNEFDDIASSIKKFGIVDPFIVNNHPKRKNVIIGGHQRKKVAKALGYKTVPVRYVTLPLEEEKELNIRLNKNTGDWDWEKLIEEFDTDSLLDWGFLEGELDSILNSDINIAGHGEKEIDENIETDHECPKCGYKY